jgi:hypothetical protein
MLREGRWLLEITESVIIMAHTAILVVHDDPMDLGEHVEKPANLKTWHFEVTLWMSRMSEFCSKNLSYLGLMYPFIEEKSPHPQGMRLAGVAPHPQRPAL